MTTHFRNLQTTAEQTVIMFEALADLTPKQLLSGIGVLCLAHEEIYPGTNLIAKIRKYSLGNHKKETASKAWEVAKKGSNQFFRITTWNSEKKRNGEHFTAKRIIFKNALLDRTMQAIGHSEFYNTENEGVLRAHFFKIYNEFLEAENLSAILGENSSECVQQGKTK